MLNTKENFFEFDIDEEKKSMLEVVCDAGYAGQQKSRK